MVDQFYRDDSHFKSKELLKTGTYTGWYGVNDPISNIGNESIDELLVDGSAQRKPGIHSNTRYLPCPLCQLTNVEQCYYFSHDFVVVSCPKCELPMMVVVPHSMNIRKGLEDKINYIINFLFGSVTIEKSSEYGEHMNWHIIRQSTDAEKYTQRHIIPNIMD